MAKFKHKLPDELEPVGEICVKVNIPNHPDYVALFVRAIRMLEIQSQYERDSSNLGAKTVAAQWRDRTITPLINTLASETDYCNVIENCQDIADCIDDPDSPSYTSVTNISNDVSNINIENNNTVINQDRNLTPDADGFLEKRFKSLDRDEPIVPPVGSCNTARKNEIYAGTLEIVHRLSEMALDFMQDVNTQADSVQRAARAVGLIPIIGDVAGETILAFAEVIPDLLNLYESHESLAQMEDVACDLFCIHSDSCGYPTFDELINYYKSVGISGIDDIADISMTALVDAVIGTNGLAASVVWYAMNTFVLYFLYVESTFLGRRGKKWINIYAANGELLPNDDWILLCDCGYDTWTWDYAATACAYGLPSGWSVTLTEGACGDGVGAFDGIWDTSTGALARVIIVVSFPAQVINNVRVKGFMNGTHSSNVGFIRLQAGTIDQTNAIAQYPVVSDYTFTVGEVISSFTITAQHSTSSFNPRGVAVNFIAANI